MRFHLKINLDQNMFRALTNDKSCVFQISVKAPLSTQRKTISNVTVTTHTDSPDSASPQPSRRYLPRHSKGERECRRVLESRCKKPFPSIWHPEIVNPLTNNLLELDCFNEELMLGLEYQGLQHYRYNTNFHRTYQDFVNLQERDRVKKRRCQELGIHLIIVPYTVSFEDIESFILSKLAELDLFPRLRSI